MMGGVPSLASSPGIDYVGKPADFGEQKRREYVSSDYHKPTDQIKPDWDLSGSVEDLQVLLEVGYRVAQAPEATSIGRSRRKGSLARLIGIRIYKVVPSRYPSKPALNGPAAPNCRS